MTSQKVVIVGAGAAGVTCAAWLIKHGVKDVTVLEAQDYIGGRIKAEIVDGQNLDLGAQFVHGREGNPVYEIACKIGLAIYPDPATDNHDDDDTHLIQVPEEFFTSSGQKLSHKETNQLVEFLTKQLFKEATDDTVEIDDEGRSEGECYEEAYRKFLEDNGQKLSPRQRETCDAIFRWYSAYQSIDTAAADLRELSVWALSLYRVLRGPRFTYIHGGLTAILNAVVDLLPRDVIRLNTPVANVDWSQVQEDPVSGQISVTCKNGEVFPADYVIVTSSLGYLQATHQEMFTPGLPQEMQAALSNFGFGGIGKIFLKWDEPFIGLNGTTKNGDVRSFELLWLDSHPLNITSDRCPEKTRFGKPWWYGIHSVETVYGNPNILEFWLNREQAKIMETLDESEVKAVCHEILQNFFKDIKIPEISAIYRTMWVSNPYTQGTYSFLSSRIKKDDLNNLGKPLPSSNNPRVLFAGEGYANEFISTVHGAMLSGQKQANVILNDQGIKPSSKLVDLI
ncbi:unnamed protein product [Lymnaea stagnalis]|uniref:Amine oxidase domain-containing protein n=1 Tax=Lymnaea stagnalis TaxID=6523 RepID=A0AAV2H3I5_LYMST